MSTVTATASPVKSVNSLTSGKLPRSVPWTVLGASWLIMFAVFAILNAGQPIKNFNIAAAVFLGTLLFVIAIGVLSSIVEGRRKAADRVITAVVSAAFIVALLPLISLLYTVVVEGVQRFDIEFFSSSMRNVVGAGGGAIHAIYGTLLITAATTVISVPIGLMTSIYLVEYSTGSRLSRAITFFVDVMTGIPSIVAGLFAYAVFALFFGPGISMGIIGAIALSVLMIPVVVRSSEEMLRLVPNELREAAYALGVPKWLTILKVVIPTSIAGITTGIMLAIARVIGETAPLLLTAGYTQSLNLNLFDGNMMTLPVYVYNQYANQGTTPDDSVARAWAGALTLILIVMVLNLAARMIAKLFSPKTGRR
ncbi:phosphate transport system permease protein [Microbacterium endophyticum]|uniref:Phosphate transport system permease protein PstA n=1 Tax=Microbacterium endophyticum TaxID=1526412 RepID=A0A7W4YMF4_9MICO|nr:phosphate ABC transporter permease PstA [Microbacterium endophyticum]MBB2975052.1 phosphate transport system permease protein [Microbacterium endophyticum]NIK37408.1 phosphate transport system permease protein [Microbacterium endophyticum]